MSMFFASTLEEMTGEPEKKETTKAKGISELDNTPIEWLVSQWIPKKGITLLCSDGGVGKTFVWVSIVSSLSRGENTFLRYDPEFHEEKKALCFSGEDPENILRSRFEKAGCKPENVFVIAQDSEINISFSSPELEELISYHKPSIVIFDPLQSFIGAGVDMSRRNQMRSALRPLGVLSSKYNIPFVIVSHTNKRGGESGRNKMADSSDLWDIARSVIMCGFTEDGNRYVSLEKSSYGDLFKTKSVIFSLDGGKVNFIEMSENKMKDFVKDDQKREYTRKAPTLKQDCCNDILKMIAENGGSMDQKDLDEMLLEIYSRGTLKNAKNELVRSGFVKMQRFKGGKINYLRTEKA